jgi:serine protease Do
VAGRPIDSREAFSTLTATLTPGSTVEVNYEREGQKRRVQLRAEDPPSGLGMRILEEVAGLRIADERRSVVIDEVIRGSRAEDIGLAPGDVIVAINNTEVKDTRAANTELIRAADRSSIVLSVARGRYVYSLTFPMGR